MHVLYILLAYSYVSSAFSIINDDIRQSAAAVICQSHAVILIALASW